MTQNSTGSRRENRSEALTMKREARMPNRKHPTMKTVQAASLDYTIDGTL